MARGFTSVSPGGLLGVLINECSISAAWDPGSKLPEPPMHPFRAIWDTGATNSVITQGVIDRCGLAPTGMVEVHGVHGKQLVDTYLANIRLPNGVGFAALQVTLGDLGGDADLLVGMDIISQGDFAVTNFGGLTKFSFQVPSGRHIDFVEEINLANRIASRQVSFGHGGNPPPRPRGKRR